jgi:hypothetical protein
MSTTPTDETTTPVPEQAPTEPAESTQPQNAQPSDSSASTGSDEQPTEEEPTDEPPAEEQPAPVELQVSIEMMLFEAGMIANSLSSKSLGAALADRLYEEEQVAEQAQQSRFTFRFSPFEAGMALGAMSRSADGSLDELQVRLGDALAAKMEELGVPAIDNGNGGSVGGGL